jgi:hypothetical protein
MSNESLKAQAPPLVIVKPHCLAPIFRVKSPMHPDELLRNTNLYRQLREKPDGLATEVPPRPIDGLGGSVAKAVRRNLSSNSPVVIASYTQNIQLPQKLYAFGRVRIVSYNVPQAHDTINALARDLLQTRL